MIQAEELLINSDLTINQIAFSCGYANQLSFSKAFSNTHSLSPREFRKQNKMINNSRMNNIRVIVNFIYFIINICTFC